MRYSRSGLSAAGARGRSKETSNYPQQGSCRRYHVYHENYAQGLGGVIHCYSYSREMAEEYVKMGFYIGIGGVVTFKNAKKLKDVAAAIPIEKIVLETDCPYMAPEPYRGKRNQSSYIQYVAEKIAELKEMSPEEVIAVTEKNARDLYGI